MLNLGYFCMVTGNNPESVQTSKGLEGKQFLKEPNGVHSIISFLNSTKKISFLYFKFTEI